jgi:SAM-dependent methyltransferase
MADWFENDAFWEAFYPALFGRARWESAEGEAAAALKLLGLPGGARLLDFCCGPGRHATAFAKLGLRVVGVDRTAFYLGKAREHARASNVAVDFVQSDVRGYRSEEPFDGAVSLYTSFGYFEDAQEDGRLLERLRMLLRPGGRLLMDMMGKEIARRHFQPKSWTELDDGRLFLEERTPVDGWQRMANRWILAGEGTRVEGSFTVRMYTGSELTTILTGAGFAKVTLMGNLDGDPYDEHARRLVALAER